MKRLLTILGVLAVLAGSSPMFAASTSRVEVQRIDVQPKIIIEPPRSRDFHVSLTLDQDRYYIGDTITMRYRSNRDAQVYIFDTDTRGVTRQIFPNYFERDNSIRSGRTYRTPDPSYTMRISGPPGRETLRLIAFAKEYRVLRQWEEYSRSDPFPSRALGPDRMLDEVAREYANSNRERLLNRRPLAAAPQTIEIVPGQDFDYTETVVSFNVLSSSYRDRYDDRDRYNDHGQYNHSYPPDRGTTSLRVSSDVAGADIYVDGYFYGTSPGTFYVSPGRHTLTITDPGYGSKRTEINAVAGVANSVTLNLRR